jgi:hypothetical protein
MRNMKSAFRAVVKNVTGNDSLEEHSVGKIGMVLQDWSRRVQTRLILTNTAIRTSVLHTNSCCSGKGLVANYCENFYKGLGTLWLAAPLSVYRGYSNPWSLSYQHVACEKLQ